MSQGYVYNSSWGGYISIWNGWCRVSVAGDTATATSTVWSGWISNATSASGAECSISTADTIWQGWSAVVKYSHVEPSPLPPPTPEELERRRRDEETWRQQEQERLRKKEEELKKREAAVARAEQLLRLFLTEEQLAELERNKCFHVQAPSGTRYQIGRGQHGNIAELDANGKKIRRYCIQPTGGLPDPDAMLAQKLMLETDEERFKRIANVTHLAA